MENIYSEEEQTNLLLVLENLIPLVVKGIEEKNCKVVSINVIVNETERGYSYTVKLTNENIYFPHGKVCSVDFKKNEITEYADLYSCVYATNQIINDIINDKEILKNDEESCFYNSKFDLTKRKNEKERDI